MKLSIVIPVHNEESTVDEIIRRVDRVDLNNVEKEMVVVDDGSTDDTYKRLASHRNRPDIVILRHPVNLGKGTAIRTALPSVTGDLVLIQDADLEYDPDDYPALIEPIIEDKADVVYGSRFRGRVENMRLPNFLANKVLAWTASLLFLKRITDEATCYKAFRTEILRSFDLQCQKFEFCPEVTAKTLKRGYRLVEVPINYHGRTIKGGKKVRASDGIQAVYTLLKYRMKD